MPIFNASRPQDWARWALKKIDLAAEQAKQKAAREMIVYIKTDLIPMEPRPPIDTKAYRDGWYATPQGEIVNLMPYARFIEDGVNPRDTRLISRPMIDALKGWADRHGFGGRFSTGKKPVDRDAELTSVAWAIAVGIRRRGIFKPGQGLRILERAKKRALWVFALEGVKALLKEFGG